MVELSRTWKREQLEAAAHHEAGHAVAACILHGGWAFERVWVEQWPDDAGPELHGTFAGKIEEMQPICVPGFEAEFEKAFGKDGQTFPYSRRRSEILVNLAGPVAEARFVDQVGRGEFELSMVVWLKRAEREEDENSDFRRAMLFVDETDDSILVYLADAWMFLSLQGAWEAVQGVADTMLKKKPTTEGRHMLSFPEVVSIVEMHVPRPWIPGFELPPLDRTRDFRE